ncbi:GNAT family N-acetyltransferase [Marinomonas sp. C2222]|uniref:GNAT family N-acetyltransferase n=1 Tax=Marinomonas sargassi TaxID=2984494 RepID=A0ABT2YR83_9GAMM|nr:GNAT family N-acetyltransferase [Marinomonas sargassi]MCV2402401.1 GNAT family N-acetyltransferase [Marinomonas sargassi]
MTAVTTYYLEMNSPSELIEKTNSKGLNLLEVRVDQFEFNRFLYQYIGGPWEWTDKLSLPDDEWKQYVENPNLRTWVAYFDGAIAGYFELLATDDGDTEIAYFGLSSPFIGRGFGGYLLSEAIKCAWQMPSTRRVFVHTCTLDHESALRNYQARGLKIYKEETE